MGNLYLVRHGQASFGAADYDNLSELGHRQSVRLGEYFAGKGLQFDAVITGTLKRHAQTWAGIAQGAGLTHQPLDWPGLNEYDSHALIRCIRAEPPAIIRSPLDRSARATSIWRSALATASSKVADAPSATAKPIRSSWKMPQFRR